MERNDASRTSASSSHEKRFEKCHNDISKRHHDVSKLWNKVIPKSFRYIVVTCEDGMCVFLHLFIRLAIPNPTLVAVIGSPMLRAGYLAYSSS